MIEEAYRDDHAMALANGSATSEERDDEDDDADHNQRYRREREIAGNVLHVVGIIVVSDLHYDTHG